MNIQLGIKIPYKDLEKDPISIVVNTLLNPFYISETELLVVFFDEYSNRLVESAREVIFLCSLRADDIINLKLKLLTDKDILLIKRELTLCLAISMFGLRHNSDFIKSMSRSKTLADFTVSTTMANDSGFVNSIIKDAKKCVEDLLGMIEELNGSGLVNIFVKGEFSNFGFDSSRLWHHRNLSIKSTETHGSLKKEFKGRFYKNGGNYAAKP